MSIKCSFYSLTISDSIFRHFFLYQLPVETPNYLLFDLCIKLPYPRHSSTSHFPLSVVLQLKLFFVSLANLLLLSGQGLLFFFACQKTRCCISSDSNEDLFYISYVLPSYHNPSFPYRFHALPLQYLQLPPLSYTISQWLPVTHPVPALLLPNFPQ